MGPSADTLARSLLPQPQRDHYRMIYTTVPKLSSRALLRAARYYLLPHYVVYTPAFRFISNFFFSPLRQLVVHSRRMEENSCALLIIKKPGEKTIGVREYLIPFFFHVSSMNRVELSYLRAYESRVKIVSID